MNKTILGITALALAGATVPNASADDCGWATAGKILTGVVAGVAIGRALEPAPAAYVPASSYYGYGTPACGYSYSYCPPTPLPPPAVVVYAPPPRPVIYAAPPRVVCAPAPVLACRPSVVVAPPVVGMSFYFGSGHSHGKGQKHHGHH